ncbi:female-specific protein transformer-like [Phymastichus coffea]|uniref:female-specific protein transformer-like n=1 Tax=Phymastichus coffea TaxID=108790 RepID=UPI00273B34B2|nr:female-specific protein transformer-like [Phymastichus coffea]
MEKGPLDSISQHEKERRRRLWMIQQKKIREHERLKQKKIEEYQRRRAKELGLPYEGKSLHVSRSKSRSRSRSEESHHRSHSRSTHNSVSQDMSKKINSSSGNKPLFNGPSEALKLSESDLHKITVQIKRKIPASSVENTEINRTVVNPEEIKLKRREGEGAKPIFDREELKPAEVEVEERRIVEASGSRSQDKKPRQKRRSVSLSPKRHRTSSPHSRSERHGLRYPSHRSRHEEHYRYHLEDRYYKDHKEHKSDRHNSSTRNGSREESRRSRSLGRRSQSRDRDYRRSERDDYSCSRRTEKVHREFQTRSKDRSHDRRNRRDSSAERHHSAAAIYIEQIKYPMYFGGFPPRPVMIPPALPPIRLPGAGRGRMPLAPMRPPYPPRFVPPDMYRSILPSDSRYPRMF